MVTRRFHGKGAACREAKRTLSETHQDISRSSSPQDVVGTDQYISQEAYAGKCAKASQQIKRHDKSVRRCQHQRAVCTGIHLSLTFLHVG